MEDIETNVVEKWLNQWQLHRSLFLTLTFNTYVRYGYGETTKERMRKCHKHFFNELHRQVYKKSYRKIPRYVVIERGSKIQGFHSHVLIETPEHIKANIRSNYKERR